MTEQSGTATAQLKQLLVERVKQGVGAAATLAGQQAGVMAQAVRQAGEQMREQGEEGQGKRADKVAKPVQQFSGSLSEYDAETLNLDPKQVRPRLAAQLQKAKTQIGQQLGNHLSVRAAQAGQGVDAVTAGAGLVGEQLQADHQQVAALVVTAVVEKVSPVSTYLSSADPTKVRGDIAGLGRQGKTTVSSVAGAVSSKQQAAAAKGTQVVKQTGTGFRQSPFLPALGAVVVAVAVAARRGGKTSSAPSPATPVAVDATVPAGVPAPPLPASDLDDLSRAQLRERAQAAGIATDANMSKNELRDLLGHA